MNSHLTTTTAGTRTWRRRPSIAAAGGAAIVLAVAVAIGMQQGTGEPRATTTAPAGPVAATSSARPVTDAGRDQLTFYLTDSRESADWFTRIDAEAADIRASMGLPLLKVEVLVITSAEQEAAVAASLDEANFIRQSAGLPAITIVDLRAPSTAEQEAAPSAAQADLDAIRAGMGLPPVTVLNTRQR